MFIRFSADASLVGPFLEEKYSTIVLALTNKLNAINYALQSKIVDTKLSGQVLEHRSGKLAGSIRVNEATNDGTTIQGGVQGGGGPAFYGKYHEYGGTFEAIRGRRVALGGKNDRLSMMLDAKKYGYEATTHVQSKPYSITFPKRSFMVSSLEESQPAIIEGLKKAVREAAQ